MSDYRDDVSGPENEGVMTILDRFEQWKAQGTISPEQHSYLTGLSRGERFSLFLELNVLLYAGVLAFVTGLGWTVSTWSQQIGDVLVLTILSTILAACFWYCFSRAPDWSPAETPAPSPIFDYVLYLGALIWSLELAYLENRFHVLSGQLDLYLLATAALFFFHHLALVSPSGRFLSPIRPSLLYSGRRRRDASPVPRPQTAFLRNLSEHRGQRSILDTSIGLVRSRRQ
jgi:hypothetical protein